MISLDPDFEMLELQRRKGRARGPAVVAVAEALPFRDATFDACIATLVMCEVDVPKEAAREVRRVLRAGGALHAIDHVASGSRIIRRLQRRLAPAWHRLTAGCRIDRDTLETWRGEGFDVKVFDDALGGVFVRYEARPSVTAPTRPKSSS